MTREIGQDPGDKVALSHDPTNFPASNSPDGNFVHAVVARKEEEREEPTRPSNHSKDSDRSGERKEIGNDCSLPVVSARGPARRIPAEKSEKTVETTDVDEPVGAVETGEVNGESLNEPFESVESGEAGKEEGKGKTEDGSGERSDVKDDERKSEESIEERHERDRTTREAGDVAADAAGAADAQSADGNDAGEEEQEIRRSFRAKKKSVRLSSPLTDTLEISPRADDAAGVAVTRTDPAADTDVIVASRGPPKKETKAKSEPESEVDDGPSTSTAAPEPKTAGRTRGRPRKSVDSATAPAPITSTIVKGQRRQSLTFSKGIAPKTVSSADAKAAATWRSGLNAKITEQSDFRKDDVYRLAYLHLLRQLDDANNFELCADEVSTKKSAAADKKNEVLGREKEGAAKWDQQEREMEKRMKERGEEGGYYKVDYVVASTARPFLSGKPFTMALVKYESFPVPSWIVYAEPNLHTSGWEWERRVAVLDMTELQLRRTLGNAEFERLFPNRWLRDTKWAGRGNYAADERSLYTNRIRAIESSWNVACAQKGVPGVYIEDWTGLPEADDELRSLLYMDDLCPDEAVKKLLKHYHLAGNVKCGKSCKSTCVYAEKSTVRKECCGLQCVMRYDKLGNVSMRTDYKKLTEAEMAAKPLSNLYYECLPECHPKKEDEDRCANRRLARGRTQTVVVFRDPKKGWTLRLSAEMKKFEFLTAYVGEVTRASSAAGTAERIYDFSMPVGLTLKTGKVLKPFTINAYRKGNEARFIAHSCEGNVAVINVVKERYGAYYARPAFLADRQIDAGEEACFDYFAAAPNHDVSVFFPACSCGAKTCRYDAERVKQLAEDRKRELEEGGEESGEDGEDEEEEGGEIEESGIEGNGSGQEQIDAESAVGDEEEKGFEGDEENEGSDGEKKAERRLAEYLAQKKEASEERENNNPIGIDNGGRDEMESGREHEEIGVQRVDGEPIDPIVMDDDVRDGVDDAGFNALPAQYNGEESGAEEQDGESDTNDVRTRGGEPQAKRWRFENEGYEGDEE